MKPKLLLILFFSLLNTPQKAHGGIFTTMLIVGKLAAPYILPAVTGMALAWQKYRDMLMCKELVRLDEDLNQGFSEARCDRERIATTAQEERSNLSMEIERAKGAISQYLEKVRRGLSNEILTVGREVRSVNDALKIVQGDVSATSQSLCSATSQLSRVGFLTRATLNEVDNLQGTVRAQGMLLFGAHRRLAEGQREQRKILDATAEGVVRLESQIGKGITVSSELVQQVARAVVDELRNSILPTLPASQSGNPPNGVWDRLRKRRGTTSLPCSSLQFAKHAMWMHYAKSGQQAIAAWPTS